MTYFANEREIDGDLSKFSNVIPVHIKCIDWYVVLTLPRISAHALAPELIRIGARLNFVSGLREFFTRATTLETWNLNWQELLNSSAVNVDLRVQHLVVLQNPAEELIMLHVHLKFKNADGIVYVTLSCFIFSSAKFIWAFL